MAYSDFTLRKVSQDFHLTLMQGAFLPKTQPITPSPYLTQFLETSLPLAIALGTEKARSGMLICPILIEVRELLNQQVSLFSGTDFTVDPSLGLSGICDFVISRSPEQILIEAPVAVIVEAKKDDLNAGLGQCIAEMVAAQKFNQQQNNSIGVIYGSVTTGSLWRFIKLENQMVTIDLTEYSVPPIDKILGILTGLVSDNVAAALA
ncbi:hypothetical protein K9N68_32935 [Kovacikia minuta CCNUW1]|uniref:hypothetical protein n=1 Tax=Kovacikia minuta TaxID=2931930 RepID=UPI001CCFA222|nr:hypothetical protein [Kovacikia minuta]UBF26260.1 hypothetical protein K9N68_32935 [Kovacikia minuta CCNUW1]